MRAVRAYEKKLKGLSGCEAGRGRVDVDRSI
jgi:hypothetical protein